MDIVNNLNSDRDLMEFVVPTVDAILTEESQVLREVVQNVINARGKDTFMQSLKSFIYVIDHRPATCEAAIHLLSLLYGEINAYDERKSFLLDLIHLNK